MKNNFSYLRGLIIGCGSIGERHLHNLQELGVKNIAVCEQSKTRAQQIAQKYKVTAFFNLDSALSYKPNFAFICTHPKSHLPLANKCLDANLHIFIEKPISSKLKGVEYMLKHAESKKLQVCVGYNMRFHDGLNMVKNHMKKLSFSKPLIIISEFGNNIKHWRPGLNYKNHYILKKGGGIILDASHEFDYMTWLLDDEIKSVYCKTKKITNIKTETESIATILMTFKKGTMATLVLDYVRPKYERRCQIIGENGELKWEFVPKPQSWKKYDSKANVTVSYNLLDGKKSTKSFTVKTNDMYVQEVRNFLDSIVSGKKPLVDGWAGLKTLKICMASLNSAKSNKPILL